MKTFLSIGSGPGIGAATAERFAKEGFRVVLTSRDPAKLVDRVAAFAAKGYAVESRMIDAGELSSVHALIEEVEAEFGSIDVLHFNSASMHSATIESQPKETFTEDLIINIGAALVAVQGASAGMLRRGHGTILLTGGIFGVTPNPDYLSLSIGKAGIRSLVHGIFDSFKDRGVHVGTVTVGTLVAPESEESKSIADAFWNLHAQPKESWSAEVPFPA
jgi:NAD(P)-dependent dehydrogenase (short-subunit alcohol dehydrogenase family)